MSQYPNKPEPKTSIHRQKLSLLIVFFALILGMTYLPVGHTQTAEKIKAKDDEVRKTMQVISRQLGVTCNQCHDAENFASDKKMEFKISKEHMRLTQVLIDHGMDGTKGPKADCFLCHRGKLTPDYKEKVHPLTK